MESAKGDAPDELYFRITAYNRSDKAASLHILPHCTLRNIWSWGADEYQEVKNHTLSKLMNTLLKLKHKSLVNVIWYLLHRQGLKSLILMLNRS